MHCVRQKLFNSSIYRCEIISEIDAMVSEEEIIQQIDAVAGAF